MGSDLEFADGFVGVTGVEVTHIPGPSETEQFLRDPTSFVLLAILAVLVVGFVVFFRQRSN